VIHNDDLQALHNLLTLETLRNMLQKADLQALHNLLRNADLRASWILLQPRGPLDVAHGGGGGHARQVAQARPVVCTAAFPRGACGKGADFSHITDKYHTFDIILQMK
jgi:hypothetical protein